MMVMLILSGVGVVPTYTTFGEPVPSPKNRIAKASALFCDL